MMQIFPYIFYTFSKIYRAGLDRRDPDVYACGFLSLMQMLNIILVCRNYLEKQELIYLTVALSLVLGLGNFFFFNAKTLKKFDERWDGEPKRKRMLKRTLVAMYVIMTFVLFFAL